MPRSRETAEHGRPAGVVGGDHAALTDRQVGGGVEAEAGRAGSADGLVLEPAADTRPHVLDHGVRRHPGSLGERRHLGLVARPVRRPPGRAPDWCGRPRERARPSTARVRGDVEQHRPQARPEDGLHHRARGQRGQGDPRTVRKAEGAQGELDRGGSGGDGHCVVGADVGGELALEGRDLRPLLLQPEGSTRSLVAVLGGSGVSPGRGKLIMQPPVSSAQCTQQGLGCSRVGSGRRPNLTSLRVSPRSRKGRQGRARRRDPDTGPS